DRHVTRARSRPPPRTHPDHGPLIPRRDRGRDQGRPRRRHRGRRRDRAPGGADDADRRSRRGNGHARHRRRPQPPAFHWPHPPSGPALRVPDDRRDPGAGGRAGVDNAARYLDRRPRLGRKPPRRGPPPDASRPRRRRAGPPGAPPPGLEQALLQLSGAGARGCLGRDTGPACGRALRRLVRAGRGRVADRAIPRPREGDDPGWGAGADRRRTGRGDRRRLRRLPRRRHHSRRRAGALPDGGPCLLPRPPGGLALGAHRHAPRRLGLRPAGFGDGPGGTFLGARPGGWPRRRPTPAGGDQADAGRGDQRPHGADVRPLPGRAGKPRDVDRTAGGAGRADPLDARPRLADGRPHLRRRSAGDGGPRLRRRPGSEPEAVAAPPRPPRLLPDRRGPPTDGGARHPGRRLVAVPGQPGGGIRQQSRLGASSRRDAHADLPRCRRRRRWLLRLADHRLQPVGGHRRGGSAADGHGAGAGAGGGALGRGGTALLHPGRRRRLGPRRPARLARTGQARRPRRARPRPAGDRAGRAAGGATGGDDGRRVLGLRRGL
ncbi:MAG: hypothetical protein AVDCRST_MAG59-47, partial [uncultured Thermomicrobiales bacterium]